jgi:hypothetical protein
VTGSTAVNEDVRVRFYGDTAIVTGRLVTKAKVGVQEIAGFTSRFTDTWVRRQGRWQVVARHYSRVPVEHKAATVETKQYEQYVGEYELAPGMAFSVLREGGKLLGQTAGQSKLELHPESEIVFFTNDPPALFIFVRNEGGLISGMLSVQDGRVTFLKRVNRQAESRE